MARSAPTVPAEAARQRRSDWIVDELLADPSGSTDDSLANPVPMRLIARRRP